MTKIQQIQQILGVEPDGKWGPQSQDALIAAKSLKAQVASVVIPSSGGSDIRSRVKAIATAELGTAEIEGASGNNKRIRQYLATVGLPNDPDETPWCAAFVNWTLKQVGLTGTGAANARSFLKFGKSCADDPKPFDIAVFWRGSKSGWEGHVAFFVSKGGGMIKVLGGNQGNKVSIASYPDERLLDIRRLG